MRRIRQQQAGIAHCPLSNIYFSHAVFPARRALDSGLKVGLGTDISGGSSPGILQNCRQAVSMSRALEDGVNPALVEDERGTPDSRIDFREAFWMATVGGAKVLGLQVGQFAEGFAMDALVIDTRQENGDLVVFDSLDHGDDILQKIVNNASRRNIRHVWVQGREVSSSS